MTGRTDDDDDERNADGWKRNDGTGPVCYNCSRSSGVTRGKRNAISTSTTRAIASAKSPEKSNTFLGRLGFRNPAHGSFTANPLVLNDGKWPKFPRKRKAHTHVPHTRPALSSARRSFYTRLRTIFFPSFCGSGAHCCCCWPELMALFFFARACSRWRCGFFSFRRLGRLSKLCAQRCAESTNLIGCVSVAS